MRRVSERSLILVPCSKTKRSGNPQLAGEPLDSCHLKELRDDLLEEVRIDKAGLQNRPDNQAGVLNPETLTTKAVDLYSGRLYQAAGDSLAKADRGDYPNVSILIVSALYGLVQLGEGLKLYDLKMSDTLKNPEHPECTVGEWWSGRLGDILRSYIEQNDIQTVWSLLPKLGPAGDYRSIFEDLWRTLHLDTNVRCLYVYPAGALEDHDHNCGRWLARVLPSYLTGEGCPPEIFEGIETIFRYEYCYT